MTKLALVQTKTLAKLRETKKTIKEWEKDFYCTHGFLASNEDIKNDQTASSLLNIIKTGSALLKDWKISF